MSKRRGYNNAKNFQRIFVWGSSTSGPQTEGRVAGDGKEIISGIIGTK